MSLDQLEETSNNNLAPIIANFSKQALCYEQVAHAHKKTAQSLDQYIASKNTFPTSGNILEIGCGTGLLSQYLVKRFLHEKIYFLDPAPNMLTVCRNNIDKQLRHLNADHLTQPTFIESTIEDYLANPRFAKVNFALIASSFTFHWFMDLSAIVKQLIDRLEPGGQLFFSFPAAESFPEWQEICLKLNIPFTANALPCQKELKSAIDNQQATIDCRKYPCQVSFNSALQFFQEMKMLGATSSVLTKSSNQENMMPSRKLTVGDFRRLLKTWHGPIKCTYKIIEGIITRHN